MSVLQRPAKESPILAASELKFDWSGNAEKALIDLPNWQVQQGESWCLFGPSGCGKSTLLNLITGVIEPNEGSFSVCGKNLAKLSNKAKDKFRADHMGYIFQQFNLLPYLSPLKNVILPTQFSKQRAQQSKDQFKSVTTEAEHWLNTLGLDKSLWHGSVLSLSLGQQQRVAAARALMGKPALIIADEPTSALDPNNAALFIDTLKSACSEQQTTLILVSHDPQMQSHFSHVWSLNEGQPK